jgi:tungstate transport system ATP-binding protein
MRALAIRPSFLFLDEPCANLDPKTTQIIENLIKIVSKSGVKIIIVTHDLFQAKRLANDILFFHNGKIIEHTKTKSFFKNPRSKEVKDFQEGLLLK